LLIDAGRGRIGQGNQEKVLDLFLDDRPALLPRSFRDVGSHASSGSDEFENLKVSIRFGDGIGIDAKVSETLRTVGRAAPSLRRPDAMAYLI
jgi:hypothetical protein